MKKREEAPKVSDDLDAFQDWETGDDLPQEEAADEGGGAEMAFEPHGGVGEDDDTQVKPIIEPPPKAKTKEKEKEKEKPRSPVADELLQMSADVPVHLVAVIGKTTVTVKDMMKYQMGEVIDLGAPPGETVDMVANGKLFARGELVEIDGKLGVKIVKIMR